MGHVSPKKSSLAPRMGYFPDFHFGIQDQRAAMSILRWLPTGSKSRLRRVPSIAAEEESETTPETENKSNQCKKSQQ
jgi:hypothetical protein